MEPVTSFESDRYFSQSEFARWCQTSRDDMNRYELLNGRIVMNPPSGWPQGEVGLTIGSLLSLHVRRGKLGRTFGPDQGFELPSGDTVAPDVSWVSTERWAASAPHVPGKFLSVVPDLVVEVLSPSTASRDRGEKKAIYERNGVREHWLVDARARQVVSFRSEGGRFDAARVDDEAAVLRSLVLPDLAAPVRDLFGET